MRQFVNARALDRSRAQAPCGAMTQRIAIIGAGLAGLTAARTLADAGRAVAVFEKSRGLGGRLATRRTGEGWWFNHGAPAIDGHAPAFLAFLAQAERDGRARHGDGGWVGRPGMSAVVGGLADGLDIRFGVEVAALARDGAGWLVAGERFAAVICAAPAPQTARLCADAPRIAEAARAAVMAPCWTLMTVWGDERPLHAAPPFDAVIADATEGGAPGPRWVAHAAADWSRAHLERERDDVAAELWACLAEGVGGEPAFAQAHRWRFARVERPVGVACVAQHGLVAAGDWLLGPDAAHAHASGLAAAAALA